MDNIIDNICIELLRNGLYVDTNTILTLCNYLDIDTVQFILEDLQEKGAK